MRKFHTSPWEMIVEAVELIRRTPITNPSPTQWVADAISVATELQRQTSIGLIIPIEEFENPMSMGMQVASNTMGQYIADHFGAAHRFHAASIICSGYLLGVEIAKNQGRYFKRNVYAQDKASDIAAYRKFLEGHGLVPDPAAAEAHGEDLWEIIFHNDGHMLLTDA